MKLRLLLTALLLLSASTRAAVNIQVNENLFIYENPARLSKILLPVANLNDWYWPATTLYDLNDRSIEEEKHRILYEIDKLTLNMHRSDQTYQALQAVKNQIRGWVVHARLPKAVNFYQSRLNIERNPLFSDGDYLLRLRERPQYVEVVGAVSESLRFPHAGNQTLDKLVARLTLLPGADESFVYVIYPDGRVFKWGQAYWNKSFAPLMPGSIIFVPVSGWGDETLEDINQRISQLLVNREVNDD